MTPTIFMVSLPRSGTVYTWHSLMDLSGLRPPEFGVQPDILKFKQKGSFDQDNLYAIGDFGTQFLLAKGLRRRLRKFNGVPRDHFSLFLKECEWRFNNPHPQMQMRQIKQWVREFLA
jgi:transposase-like protein